MGNTRIWSDFLYESLSFEAATTGYAIISNYESLNCHYHVLIPGKFICSIKVG